MLCLQQFMANRTCISSALQLRRPTALASSMRKNLGITSNNLHPVHSCHLIVRFERRILQDERPNIVTKSVGMKMTLLWTKKHLRWKSFHKQLNPTRQCTSTLIAFTEVMPKNNHHKSHPHSCEHATQSQHRLDAKTKKSPRTGNWITVPWNLS